MKLSVCMASYDRPKPVLERVLKSIFRQNPPFDFEVIVVDDGSPSSGTRRICGRYPVRYVRIQRPPGRRNPAIPRNVAYRMAQGDILLCQSDDVVHVTQDTMATLVRELEQRPEAFVLATVYGCNPQGKPRHIYSGIQGATSYFFLGAVWKRDLYSIGGNDEDFDAVPSSDDCWLDDCLKNGLGLIPHFTDSAVGHHLYHPRRVSPEEAKLGRELLRQKREAGIWCSRTGPWEMNGLPGPSREDREFATACVRGSDVPDPLLALSHSLPGLFRCYGIRSVLDVPCNSPEWIHHVTSVSPRYVGVTMNGSLVEQYQLDYPRMEFERLNLLNSDLPRADLVVCRNCLGFLNDQGVAMALENLKRSGSKFLLADTNFYPSGPPNRCCLQCSPSHLPPPTVTLDDTYNKSASIRQTKGLALWLIDSL